MEFNLLETIFENGESVFRDSLGMRRFELKKNTSFSGEPYYALYDDRGYVAAKAVEQKNGSDHYVEITDRYGDLLCKVYVVKNILSNLRTVVYIDKYGSTIAERVLDEQALKDKEKRIEQERLIKEVSNSRYDLPLSDTAAVVIVGLLGMGITVGFTFLYDHINTLIRIFSLLCVFASCPIMLLIFMRHCGSLKGAEGKLGKFFKRQLGLYVCTFLALAILQYLVFFHGAYSFNVFLLCFVPELLHGLISPFFRLGLSGSQGASSGKTMADNTSELVVLGTCLFVFLAQLVWTFESDFVPGLLNSIIFIFEMGFLLVMCLVAALVVSLPYKLLSKLIK